MKLLTKRKETDFAHSNKNKFKWRRNPIIFIHLNCANAQSSFNASTSSNVIFFTKLYGLMFFNSASADEKIQMHQITCMNQVQLEKDSYVTRTF